MIVIRTDASGERIFSVPPRLAEVAQQIFPGAPADAIFQLARQLVCDDLATCERLAERDPQEAADFASERLVERPHRWRQ